MKKIVILGGGDNQINLIKTAKDCGCQVIICDFRPETPGKKYADSYYVIDATNYEEVLRVCMTECVDGIISNSEYTVQVANKVATRLNLIGNTPTSIDNVMSKTSFRKIQQEANVFTPKSKVVSSIKDLFFEIQQMNFPIIIKPCESSGTRGTTKFETLNERDLIKCFLDCQNFSRNKLVVVEEFVEMPSLTTIEGDIFIYKNNILWDGLFYTTRSSLLPMVPMTYSAPLIINDKDLNAIKSTIQKIINVSELSFGEFNIEGYFNNKGEFFVIEINARQGGHDLPYYLNDFSGINYNKLLVSCATGDDSYWKEINKIQRHFKYSIMQTVFSFQDGIYDGLEFDSGIQPYITRVVEYVHNGDQLTKCKDGTSMIALVNMVFDTHEKMSYIKNNIEQLIKVKLKS